MTDNFHSKECATRHGSNECDCGYVKPLTKEQKEIERLTLELNEYKDCRQSLLFRSEGAERRVEVLKSYLEQIRDLATEWNANKMGSVVLQRKRWIRLGELARAALEHNP